RRAGDLRRCSGSTDHGPSGGRASLSATGRGHVAIGAPRHPSHAHRPRIGRDPSERPRLVIVVGGEALVDLVDEPGVLWAVHVGTLALAVDPPAAAYEALIAREAGLRKIVLDPNVRPAVFGDKVSYRARFERLMRLADIVKLSEEDAAWIYPDLELAEVL